MEVHHHSHTPRKKFSHYFWEFFMLFLAVTAGFLVENQREHFIEHRREKQYVATLLLDLKSDTAQLSNNIRYRDQLEFMTDSLINMLGNINEADRALMYFYARSLSRPQFFFPNDRTIQQLKNSGSLRLIRNIPVSDSIIFYDQHVRYLQFIFTDEITLRDNYRNIATKVFDGRVFNNMFDTAGSVVFMKPPGNPELLLTDKQNINELISAAQYLKSVVRGIRIREVGLKKFASNLILLIQREYNID